MTRSQSDTVEQDERGTFDWMRDICIETLAILGEPDCVPEELPVVARRIMARAASTSANVAQGAEAVAWFIPDDNGEVYRTTGYEHERDQWRALGHAVFPLYTAPPAQTAITEQMLEKLYWTAMDNSADILKYMEEAIALTAAQSASGETK